MKTNLSQSCSHCWVFQICWYIEYSTFTASSFRIWNISAVTLQQPNPVFLPEESPRTEMLGGLQIMGVADSDTTEWLSTVQHKLILILGYKTCYTSVLKSFKTNEKQRKHEVWQGLVFLKQRKKYLGLGICIGKSLDGHTQLWTVVHISSRKGWTVVQHSR